MELWVGGSPNQPKEWIYPLTGIVETDWAPYTFTMNWRFMRSYRWVRFEAGEPICFFFPVQRGYIEEVRPRFVSMEEAPEVLEQFKTWSASRDEFHGRMTRQVPQSSSEKWQKRYYRGVDPSGDNAVSGHQTKLRLAPFSVREAASDAAVRKAGKEVSRRLRIADIREAECPIWAKNGTTQWFACSAAFRRERSVGCCRSARSVRWRAPGCFRCCSG